MQTTSASSSASADSSTPSSTGGASLTNRNNALTFSANFIHPSPPPSSSSDASKATPVPLAHFMGGRADLRGPYLTRQRADEAEIRPAGWEAAERRAAAAQGGRGPVGLGGFLSGKAPGRALPGMVSNAQLEADRNARENTTLSTVAPEPEAAQSVNVSEMAKNWGRPRTGEERAPERSSSTPMPALTLAERLALDEAARGAGGRATAPPTEGLV